MKLYFTLFEAISLLMECFQGSQFAEELTRWKAGKLIIILLFSPSKFGKSGFIFYILLVILLLWTSYVGIP